MQNNMPTQPTQPDNSRAELTRLIVAYVISIGPGGAPSGEVYMRTSTCSLSRHTALIGALREVGLITEGNHYLQLTEAGKAMFTKAALVLMKKEVTL